MRSLLVVALFLVVVMTVFASGRVYGGWYDDMPEPLSVTLVDGELHVVWRQRSHAEYPTIPSSPVPDKVWKEIYVCGHDEIVLAESIPGKHVPASTNPERIIFPGEER